MRNQLPGRSLADIGVRIVALIFVISGFSGVLWAKEFIVSSGAAIDYSRNPLALIVSYELHVGELAGPDSGPVLRIFGDGLAHIHYPPYMSKAGDYAIQLADDELAELLGSLVSDGVLEFDANRVQGKLREIETEQRETNGVVYHVSDASTSVLELHLLSYRAPGAVTVQTANLNKIIRWKGLQSDARTYPAEPAIQNLATAEKRLRSLMERQDLVRTGALDREAAVAPWEE
jgi:hypothetical protein